MTKVSKYLTIYILHRSKRRRAPITNLRRTFIGLLCSVYEHHTGDRPLFSPCIVYSIFMYLTPIYIIYIPDTYMYTLFS